MANSGREGGAKLVNIYDPGVFEGVLGRWPVLAAAGALEVRLAETEPEVEAAQRLRYQVFYEEMSAVPSPAMREHRRDFDRFDEYCDHVSSSIALPRMTMVNHWWSAPTG